MKSYICKFVCEDKTFYWGPFETKELAEKYSSDAKEQSIEYYGFDIAKSRKVLEVNKGVF